MKKFLTFALVLVMVCAIFSVGALAVDKTVEIGEEFDVPVAVSGSVTAAYISFPISYDHDLVEYVGTAEGTLTGWTVGAKAVWYDTADHDISGTVITLKFKALAAGTASFAIAADEAYTADEDDAVVAFVPYAVEIKGDHVHDWGDWTVKTPATCTEKGVEERTCNAEGCDIGTETRDVAALGHDWGEWTVVKAATTEEAGLEERVCKNDATHKESREIAKLTHEHAWDEGTVTKEPTCTEEGEKTFKCSGCSETKVEKIAATGHTWDEGTVTKEPTCTEEGVKTFTCTKCSETKTESIDKIPHELEKHDAVAPADGKDGNIEYYECKECHKLFKDAAGKVEIKKEDTVVKYTTPTPTPAATKAPTAPGGNAAGSNPKTGDETNIALYVAILTVCGAAAVAVVSKKKNNG